MNQEIAPQNTPFEPNQQAIAQYLGLNPNDAKSHAVVAVCERYELDPVLKHVVVIPKGGVYITRDGLLHIAHRSGQFDGIEVTPPELVDGYWRCTASVYRKDMGRAFTYPGRYSASGTNKQYAEEMAIVRAESHALRRAFDVNGIPSIDEVDDEQPQRPSRHTATRGQSAPIISASDFAAPPAAEPAVDTATGEVLEGEA